MINIGPVDLSPHMDEVVGYRNFFFPNNWLSGTRIADAGRSIPTYYILIDAVWLKDVPFWGFNTKKLYWGSFSSKLPHFSAGIKIPSLNVESINFRTAGPILVICSSNDASPQKEFNNLGQTA
jgi:hypothetical protein